MVADQRWKYIHALGGFRPMLFDLQRDPNELHDLGASTLPGHVEIMALMEQRLATWGRRLSQRTTRSEQQIRDMRGKSARRGVVLGVYDGSEVDEALLAKYRGKAVNQKGSAR